MRKNNSGYTDPTAYEAIKKTDEETVRFHKILDVIFRICELGGFHVEERIVLKDKKSVRVWR